MVFVNVVQGMVSQCKSAKSALIFVRLFCVPAVAAPPGTLVAWPAAVAKTVAPGTSVAVPWKVTVAPDACAGANNIKIVGLVILSAATPIMLGGPTPLIP